MMCEPKNKKEFVDKLLAQDPISTSNQLKYQEKLFKKVMHRLWVKKITIGAIYVIVFSIAYGAFRQRSCTDNLVHSICWGAVSIHILLWFLVYFLHMIYKLSVEITDKIPMVNNNQHQKADRLITIVAIFIFLFSTILLYFSFNLDSSLKATRLTVLILWSSVFFLFWYPFGIVSLVSKLWLECKEKELYATEYKNDRPKTQIYET